MPPGYKIIRENFASGAFGSIHLAEDDGGRKFAVKVLKDAGNPSAVANIKKEYRRLAGLVHPNIVKTRDFGFENGRFYFVSEFVEDAQDLFAATMNLPPQGMVKFFTQALDALDYIHRNGFVHLDIKPSNILVDKAGKVKIIDLGVTEAFGSLKGGGIVGSLDYIAPEVILGGGVDGRTDLFSFGAVMYQCLARIKPFERGRVPLEKIKSFISKEASPCSLIRRRRDIPEYLNEIVAHLLEKDAADRFYPNARAVLNALNTHKAGLFGTCSYLRPIGDKHIGRDDLRTQLNESLQGLYKGAQPEKAVFYITGATGLGKTHLLKKIKEAASQHAEDVFVSEISFPADDAEIERWQAALQNELSENKRAVVVVADSSGEGAGINSHLRVIADTVLQRGLAPDVYEGIKPMMVVMAGCSRPDNAEKFACCELKSFSKAELEEFLASTPALKGREVPQKFVEHLYYLTGGVPAEVVDKLDRLDSTQALFGPDGDMLIPAIEEPSVNIEEWLRPDQGRGGEGRIQSAGIASKFEDVYRHLNALEKEAVDFISVWNFKGIARPATDEDVCEFFYSASIRQVIANLIEMGVLQYIISAGGLPCGGQVQPAGGRGRPVATRQLAFVNPYLQRSVYGWIAEDQREIIHDAVAGYLKSDPDAIMLHTGFGSDKQKAIGALIYLGRKYLYSHGNPAIAFELFKYALDVAPADRPKIKIYLYTLLVDACQLGGKYHDGNKFFKEAKMRLEGVPRILHVVLYSKQIKNLLMQREYSHARELICASKSMLKDAPASHLALVLRNYEGRILYEQFYDSKGGDPGLLQKAMGIFEETNLLEQKVSRLSWIQNNELGYVLLAMGQPQKAIKFLKEKLTRHEEEKDIFGRIATSCAVASTLRQLKDYKEAEELAKRSVVLAKGGNQPKWLFETHRILMNIYYDTHKFKDAIKEGSSCVALYSSFQRNCDEIGRIWVQTGHCWKELKEWNKAQVYFETAIKNEVGGHYLMWAYEGLGEACYFTKRYKLAMEHFGKAERMLAEFPQSVAAPYKDRILELKSRVKTVS